jgi:hypothetical protein
MVVTTVGDEVNLDIPSPENVGSGVELYDDSVGPNGRPWKFKTLTSSDDSIEITDNTNEVDLKVTATPSATTLQQAYNASGAVDPQIQLSDANGPVSIWTDSTTLDAALKLQKGIQYGDDFNTAPNFRIFTTSGGFAGKNTGVSIEGQDNAEDDPAAAGGDVINTAGSNTSGGAAGLGGHVINQAGTGPTSDGTVDNKVGTTLVLRSESDKNTSFFDLLLSSVVAATRKLIYVATGGTWSYEVDSEVVDAVGHEVKWPGKPTRDAGQKFQVGDIISVRVDDANNAITEWTPFAAIRQAKASYANASLDQWNGGNWVLPKDNATAEIAPDQLETTLDLANDFTLDAGGNGGRIVYSGADPKTFRVSFNFTAVRPPAISLDARGQFFIGLKPNGDPDFVQLDPSQQFHRFNIIDCDSVISVEALVEVGSGDALALMGTSDAGAASDGLGIQLKGYTLVVTEV